MIMMSVVVTEIRYEVWALDDTEKQLLKIIVRLFALSVSMVISVSR